MKAIDTNVLVRFLVADDALQTFKVRKLLEQQERRGGQLLITVPVLLETIWVLESSYNIPRSAVLDALEKLTLMPVFQLEAHERVSRMINLGRSGSLGLADILIGLTASDMGCEATLTFDTRASKSNLFEVIS